MCKKIHVELYNVTEDIHYHVATTVLETRGRTKSKEEDFQYVGNVGFNGFLFFFSVSGRFLKGFHIHGGKSHLIYIGSPRAATRSSEPSSRSYHLMQTPSVVRYSYDESGGSSGGDDSSGTIYCPICNQSYDFTLESCPNGCEIEITPPEGDLIYCEICGIVYDSGRYRSCPNGCEVFYCDVCGKFPCICLEHACERCGSITCPGPWFCSERECTGEKCKVCGGYKANTRSGSDCPVCTCEVDESYRIDLFISPNTVDLGKDYTMTVMNASTGKATITRIEYNII